MSGSGPRACPQCGNLQQEGEFCENCGAQVFVGEVPAGFPPAAPASPAPPPAAPSAAAAAAAVGVAAASQPPAPAAPPSIQATPAAAPPQQAPPAVPPVQQVPPAGGYAQPQYGEPQYAQPQYTQPAAGQPQYGGPTHGGPSFGGPIPPRRSGGGFFGSLFDFTFTSFVTPKIIKFIYILVLAVIAFAVLGIVIFGFTQGVGTGLLFLLIVGPIAAIFYLLMARLWLEVVMVLFRMEEHLAELVKKS